MKKRVFLNNWFLVKLSFKALPWYMLSILFLSVFQSFVVFWEHVFAVRFVLNVVEFNLPVEKAFNMILCTVILVSLKLFISGKYEQSITPKSKVKLNYNVRKLLYLKAKNVNLECYDDPIFYNKFTFAVNESENCIERMLDSVQKLVGSITTVVLSFVFFLSIDFISLIFVVLAFFLSTLLNNKINKVNFIVKEKEIELHKKRIYFGRILYMNEFAKEIRLFPQIKKHFIKEFNNTNDCILEIEKRFTKKKWIYGFIKDYCCNDLIINTCFIIYLLFKTLVVKTLPFSSFIVLFNSSSDFKSTLMDISEVLPEFTENSMYIQKIRDFLSFKTYENKYSLSMPKEFYSLEFRNVYFSYNDRNEVIRNLNIKITKNEKIAIVGFNGAGKSTLIKLLLRLYQPTKGKILLNGVDIKNYDLIEYWYKMGVVFQDYNIYACTVKENILLGEQQISDDKINEALRKVDLFDKFSSMEKGIYSLLTKEFDEFGINLSGGEGQRLAISRTLIEDKLILVLDEPSSALDPVAEGNINKIMLGSAEEKTIFFISHRLSTTIKSDRILFMKNGQIVEAGTHLELLENNNEYAEMWRAQSTKYLSVFKDYRNNIN